MSNRQKVTELFQPAEFIEVKGWKAIGNKLIDKKLISIQAQQSEEESDAETEDAEEVPPTAEKKKAVQADLFSAPVSKSKPVTKPAKKQRCKIIS
jgi:hypothetical protein